MHDAKWAEVRVKVSRESADAVANFLFELGSPGLQIEEADERTVLRGYLRREAQGKAQQLSPYLQQLKALGLADGHEEFEVTSLEQKDWLSIWRSRARPLRVGRRLLITPSWCEVPSNPDQIVMIIDPQMAFGTGEHATTRFCLQALEELVREGDCVLDVGTGSGILSIAAVKLGARRTMGLDVDPQAVAIARENARINDVSQRSDFSCSALDSGVRSESFHRAVANINGEVLLPLLRDIRRVLLPGGHAILAGFLAEEEGFLRRGLTESGLRLCRVECQRGWLSAVARAGDVMP
jgi:ribosomal protein L11 methyltransferase